MGKPHKRFAVKKLKRSARGELECVPSEAARRDEDATICALRRDHSEQFSDWLDWDLPVQPVLALDNHPLVAADKLEVDATVGVGSAALPHEIALPAVGFTDKEFKVRPAHLPEGMNTGGPREEEALPSPLDNTDQAGG
jgi:hypothetical protein